ncbi:MAG: hypothetical protein HY565_05490 [Candidatus Kerfeldbacteria bacterium]|nr:hypothetical protein [Candidatus Kerfeldbacteria bacterium]
MRRRFTQSLPLLGTLCLLIIGGAVLFKLTPASAIIAISAEAETLPADAEETEAGITEDTEEGAIETTEVFEPTVKTTRLDAESPEALNTVKGIYVTADDDILLSDHYLNDVFVAGNNITVTGTIDGDLFAAGANIVINGDVAGSVRVTGGNVKVGKQVGRNVVVFAEQFELGGAGSIGEDLIIGTGTTTIAGLVAGNVMGSADELIMTGTVVGEVDVEETADEPTAEKADTAFITAFQVFKLIVFWIGYLILGVVILKLLPTFSKTTLQQMRTQPGRSFGYGVLLVCAGPVVLLILMVTLIGLPLALAGGLVLFLTMLLAKIYFGAAVGQLLLPKSKSLIWPFILGFSIVYMIYKLLALVGFPWMLFGVAMMALGMTWAAGSVVMYCKKS